MEKLLDVEEERLTVFPIKNHKIWESYKTQLSAFWRVEEIDFSQDYTDFMTLTQDEQHVIKMVLAFFAISDGLINLNLRERFLMEVKNTEAQTTYAYQMMIEYIHGECYSLMLETLIKDPVEKDKLFNAVKEFESIKMIMDWAMKWINSDKSFAHRLIAFVFMEGGFFSSAFATIFWLKRYRGHGRHFMNGLIKSNEFISRDEGEHCRFACLLYSQLENKLPQAEVYEIFDDALIIAKNFAKDSIQCELIGLNCDLMFQYLECISDRLLADLGYEHKYHKTNPFTFMETISLTKKTNFFESRPTDYQSAHNKDNLALTEITLSEDF
jgi:ribonucleoside-diphosphate reductase beta chain